MPPRIYYKILWRHDDGTLRSPTASEEMTVEYWPGHKVTSDYGPIFVYPTIETAARRARRIQAAREPGVIEIWECFAHNARPIAEALTFSTAGRAEEVRRWWRGESADVISRPAFAGECVADWVIVFRRVL